jgi:hypothetical protein
MYNQIHRHLINAFLEKSRCNQSNMVVANRQWRIAIFSKRLNLWRNWGEGVHVTCSKLKLTKYVLKRSFENAEMLSHRTYNYLNATFLIKITFGFSPPPPPPPPQHHRGERMWHWHLLLFFKVTFPIYLIPRRNVWENSCLRSTLL